MSVTVSPYSSLKLFAHPEKIGAIKRGEHPAPLYVRIKPTNACNHRCNFCHYASGKYLDLGDINVKDQIPVEIMQGIITDLADLGVKAITFSGGGEPLVYPHILQTMQQALERGLEISIITHGQRLKGEIAQTLAKAKWVRISFEAANPETYTQIRGVPAAVFKEVCANIKEFATIKNPHCELGINFVVTRENAGEIFATAKLVKEMGANHIKYSARMTDDSDAYHRPIKEGVIAQLRRVKEQLADSGFSVINKYEDDFDFVYKRSYTKCVIKEVVSVIAADCKIYFCHDKAYLENGIVGDLRKASFKEIWLSPETKERYEKFDASQECCHHCAYDDRNVLLNSFLALDENHINFI